MANLACVCAEKCFGVLLRGLPGLTGVREKIPMQLDCVKETN